MREISCNQIIEAIEELCIEANTVLTPDLAILLECGWENEESEPARSVMRDIAENYRCAAREGIPICQDTGMAVVFIDIGQDVHITGRLLTEAVNEGVRRGYEKGFLRKSVVADPLRRVNTGDNTPAVLHTRIVTGNKLDITVAPKGFGSENMSAVKMFLPSNTREDIEDFIVDTVRRAGSNPCPPVVLGVGIGGTFEQCTMLAKRALLRDADKRNADPYYAEMELRVLHKINALNIGPQGFGGKTTALCVNINTAPTHIAGLPCAVNMSCHVTRHAHIAI